MKRTCHVNAEVRRALAWSPDSRHIAAGSAGHQMVIWNVATGVCTRQHAIPGELEAIAWSPDGTRLASGSVGDDWEDGQTYLLHVWDVQTGASLFAESFRVRLRMGGLFAFAHEGAVSIRWHHDSRRIALARCDNIVETWDITSRQRLSSQRHPAHADDVDSIYWSPNGRSLAAARLDPSVEIWDASNGNVLCRYRGHTRRVVAITWSPDSERIASLSADGVIQVWDAATGSHRFTYCDPSQSTGVLAWSPDGTSIASANRDRGIRIWRAA